MMLELGKHQIEALDKIRDGCIVHGGTGSILSTGYTKQTIGGINAMLMIKLPANEIVWEKISDSYGNPLYCITSDRKRDTYYLYSVNRKGETARIGKGKDPPELYKKYINKLRRA